MVLFGLRFGKDKKIPWDTIEFDPDTKMLVVSNGYKLIHDERAEHVDFNFRTRVLTISKDTGIVKTMNLL